MTMKFKGTGARHPLRILGVMTGTSCDGLDAACIEINGEKWNALWSASSPYPAALRAQALRLQQPDTRLPIRDWLALHSELGDWYGSALSRIIALPRITRGARPDIIANHGQTMAHFPGLGKRSSTLQLGDPTRIARATGLTVVSHFRQGDMAAGGQGAPLVPLFHQAIAQAIARMLAGSPGEGISIHNIGGISNLTYIGPKGILAFDTGPGNIWIDAAAELATRGRLKMDRGGRLAAAGRADPDVVLSVLRHPYFRKKAPKSTGRDDFPVSLLLALTRARDSSLVATATGLTVESIARAYEDSILKKGLPLSRIYVCGGGSKNPTLMKWLSQRMAKAEVKNVLPLNDAGFDPQLIEAQAFAYLGYLSLRGRPVGGSWTGAKSFGPPGQITPGANWPRVLELLRAHG